MIKTKIQLYSPIKLLTDRYNKYGVSKNGIGYVIETYDTGDFEVEFSDEVGTTIAQFAVEPDEIESVETTKDYVLT